MEEKLINISHLLNKAREMDYIGESVSQIEHALQAAYFAEKSGHSDEVIIASLLHDIGHFASVKKQHTMNDLGVVYHEWIGAQLAYELNFSAKVALLIGYHVDAKRYLATKKSSYFERLSTASRQTLSYQGGLMSQNELRIFEQLPYFKEILQVRINDEKAKEIDLVVPDLEYYYCKIREHIQENQHRVEPLAEQYKLTDFVTSQWVEHFKLQLWSVEPKIFS
jgi:predicted HD phosphohydrolase